MFILNITCDFGNDVETRALVCSESKEKLEELSSKIIEEINSKKLRTKEISDNFYDSKIEIQESIKRLNEISDEFELLKKYDLHNLYLEDNIIDFEIDELEVI